MAQWLRSLSLVQRVPSSIPDKSPKMCFHCCLLHCYIGRLMGQLQWMTIYYTLQPVLIKVMPDCVYTPPWAPQENSINTECCNVVHYVHVNLNENVRKKEINHYGMSPTTLFNKCVTLCVLQILYCSLPIVCFILTCQSVGFPVNFNTISRYYTTHVPIFF